MGFLSKFPNEFSLRICVLRESRKHLSLQAWIPHYFPENALSHIGVPVHVPHDSPEGCLIPE